MSVYLPFSEISKGLKNLQQLAILEHQPSLSYVLVNTSKQ